MSMAMARAFLLGLEDALAGDAGAVMAGGDADRDPVGSVLLGGRLGIVDQDAGPLCLSLALRLLPGACCHDFGDYVIAQVDFFSSASDADALGVGPYRVASTSVASSPSAMIPSIGFTASAGSSLLSATAATPPTSRESCIASTSGRSAAPRASTMR